MGVGTLRRTIRNGVTKLEDVTPKEEEVKPKAKPKKVKK